VPVDVLPDHRLGIRAMCYITYLRELRMPVEVIQTHLSHFGLTLSTATIENVCSEVASCLRPEYDLIKKSLRESKAVNMDETGMRVCGENEWLWTFTDPESTLFLIDKRRSSAVPKKILGGEPKPVMISDCFSAYNVLEGEKQRCWSHLLRDTSELEGEEGKWLHERLKHLRKEAKIMIRMPPPFRNVAAQFLQYKLDHLVNRYWSDLSTAKIVERIIRHRGEWFTFVKYRIDDTNNRAERALRPYVVFRKIIGGHRSEHGAAKHAVIRSIMETCKQRNINFFSHIENTLTETITSSG